MSFTKHIEELCLAVSREQDPQKLLSLVDELNKELDRTTEALPDGSSAQRYNPDLREFHPALRHEPQLSIFAATGAT